MGPEASAGGLVGAAAAGAAPVGAAGPSAAGHRAEFLLGQFLHSLFACSASLAFLSAGWSLPCSLFVISPPPYLRSGATGPLPAVTGIWSSNGATTSGTVGRSFSFGLAPAHSDAAPGATNRPRRTARYRPRPRAAVGVRPYLPRNRRLKCDRSLKPAP